MRRVIILTYDFPPYISVGGLRPFSWFKYFKEFGIIPIVVTRQWMKSFGNKSDYIAPSLSEEIIFEESDFGLIIKAPYFPNLANRIMLRYGEENFKFFRKFFSACSEILQFILIRGPKASLFYAAKEYIEKNPVDAIIATGEPFILFKYASILSKEYKIPWIADYRDPWSEDRDRRLYFFLKHWDRYNEKKYLENAVAITTVSSFFAQIIGRNLKNKLIQVIPNGFDENSINEVTNVEQDKQTFSIGYAGSILRYHPVKSFLNVFFDFAKRNKNTKVLINFYGVNDADYLIEIAKEVCGDWNKYLKINPKKPYLEVVKSLKKNNVLLLFNYYSVVGTKIYDYIALDRKIIFCFEDDQDANRLKRKYHNIGIKKDFLSEMDIYPQIKILKETNTGIIVRNKSHLSLVLDKLLTEFINTGLIYCKSESYLKFSRKNQIRQLAELVCSFKKESI